MVKGSGSRADANMNPQRDRDAAIDRALRGVLGTHAEAAGPSCPDAGRVAAYLERALSLEEGAAFERHAASCSRCQEVLAALGALEPIGGMATETEARPAWWRLGWRWLALPAAAATAAGIYVAVRSPVGQPTPVSPEFTVATRVEEAPAPRDKAVQIVPESAPAGPAPRMAAAPAAPAEALPATPVPARKSEAGAAGLVPGRDEAPARRDAELREFAPTMPAQVPGQPAASAPAPVAPSAPAVATLEKAAADEAKVAAPGLAAGEADAAKKRERAEAVPAPQAGYRSTSAVADERRLGAAQAQAASAAPAPTPSRWRVGPGGRIDRSDDGGATWRRQVSGVSEDLLAVATVSPTVGWAVGRKGVVLLTTEGERWVRRPSPVATDLSRIEAVNQLEATVTTVDGRRFTTADGGQSWIPR
jgi:hypothetical protein